MLQKKLDVLNKAGLSKDNFLDSKATQHVVKADESLNESANSSKITDFFNKSASMNQSALDDVNVDDWDDDDFGNDDELLEAVEMAEGRNTWSEERRASFF